MVRCVSTRPAKVSTDSDRGKIYIPPRSLPRFFPKKFISLFSCSCNDSSYFFFFQPTGWILSKCPLTRENGKNLFLPSLLIQRSFYVLFFLISFISQMDFAKVSTDSRERKLFLSSLVDANDRRMFFFFFLVSFNFSISWIFSI